MVSSKQRRRQLARAKWERQEVRRSDVARRNRRVSVVVGIIVGLIAVAAMIWVVMWLVDQEGERNPEPVAPADSDVPSFVSPPTTTPQESQPTAPTGPTGSATGTEGSPTGPEGSGTAATPSPDQGGS